MNILVYAHNFSYFLGLGTASVPVQMALLTVAAVAIIVGILLLVNSLIKYFSAQKTDNFDSSEILGSSNSSSVNSKSNRPAEDSAPELPLGTEPGLVSVEPVSPAVLPTPVLPASAPAPILVTSDTEIKSALASVEPVLPAVPVLPTPVLVTSGDPVVELQDHIQEKNQEDIPNRDAFIAKMAEQQTQRITGTQLIVEQTKVRWQKALQTNEIFYKAELADASDDGKAAVHKKYADKKAEIDRNYKRLLATVGPSENPMDPFLSATEKVGISRLSPNPN